jgi:hypothetical protein
MDNESNELVEHEMLTRRVALDDYFAAGVELVGQAASHSAP